MPASINDFMGGSGAGVGESRAVGVIKLPMCLLTLPRRQQLWIWNKRYLNGLRSLGPLPLVAMSSLDLEGKLVQNGVQIYEE